MKPLTQFSSTQSAQLMRGQLREQFLKAHADQIDSDLRTLGAVKYNFLLPETHTLPYIIHPGERITGIVFGRYVKGDGAQSGRGALVATTSRVLLLDKKPLFVKCDELTYHVISGVSYSKAGIAGTVKLHTRMGDISVRTYNQKCADSFLEAVEEVIFKAT